MSDQQQSPDDQPVSDRVLPSAVLTTSNKPRRKVDAKKIKAKQKAVSFALANREVETIALPDGGLRFLPPSRR